ATKHGQTRKIARFVADAISDLGYQAECRDLAEDFAIDSLDDYAALVLAAPVYSGKHAGSAKRFVQRHGSRLNQILCAFLSVGMFAATSAEGQRTAEEQARSFIDETSWNPAVVQAIGGAFRYSGFSRLWRWLIRMAERLFKKELQRLHWPSLTTDHEFTDWEGLQCFVQQLCTEITDRESNSAHSLQR
ncbi:MAG: flavodoxin domain-containing protein, partial [Pseudomonadota bacterium]